MKTLHIHSQLPWQGARTVKACVIALFAIASQPAAAQTASSSPLIVPPPMVTRTALKQPFASKSIWNHPIGKNAVYVAANLPTVPGGDQWALMPQIDEELIVLRPNAPLTSVLYSDAAWTGRNRCAPTSSTVIAQVPVPSDYIVPHSNRNNSAVFLKNDGRTLVHVQPFTRCVGMAPTSLIKFNDVDLYGEGSEGSHGGSRLSAIGGSLRVGDMRPSTGAPRHALKINVYGSQMFASCKTRDQCFVWPAKSSDSGAVARYGSLATTVSSYMKMGALLAIPYSRDINKMGFETQPGKMLAWTLQNYGAYIVDDTGSPAIAFGAEHGPDGSFRTQFKADWGFEFEQRVRDNSPWVRDMQRIVQALHVVTNNGPLTIGGGGTLLQPLAPELQAPNSVSAWKSIGVK